MPYLHPSLHESGPLGNYGWSCELRVLGRALGSAGHEIITRDAIGTGVIPFAVSGRAMSVSLTPTDIADIVLGNRSVDLGMNDADDSGRGVVTAFNPSEQKRHALRSTLTQPQPAARADIIAEFGRAHGAIIGERDPRRRMRRIGVVTHLIQDSFSPAHMDRDPSRSWCIRYIRNFGRGSAPTEHATPSDPRDSITAAGSTAARAQATAATRRYLAIVFKALRGALGPDPVAAGEAMSEVATFSTDVFRSC